MDFIPVEEQAKRHTSLELEQSDIERTLSVHWKTKEDCFTFKVIHKQSEMTKRGILKITSSVFDPLILFILKAKNLIQELWRLKVDWDEELDEHMKQQWSIWLTE